MKLTKLKELKTNVKTIANEIQDYVLEKGFLIDEDDQLIIDTFEDMMELIDEQINRRLYSKRYNKNPKLARESKVKNRLLMGLWRVKKK